MVEIGESPRSARWGRRQDPTEPLSPPVFDEDIDAQVRFALSLIGKVISKRDLSQPHKALSRILTREAKRRGKFAESGWTFDKPKFDDPTHQRHLRFFNTLSWAFERASVRTEVRDDEKWIQGIGTTHWLCLRIDFGDAALDLRFFEPSASIKVTGEKPPTSTTLRIDLGNRNLPADGWFDQDGNRIEQQLPEIIEALLHTAERVLRHDAQRRYDWRLERHHEHLKELEAQRVEAERQRLLAIEARKKKVRDEILAVAQDARMAREIRSIVLSLENHPDLQNERLATFEAWRAEALGLADTLDPMKRLIVDLLGSFELPPR